MFGAAGAMVSIVFCHNTQNNNASHEYQKYILDDLEKTNSGDCQPISFFHVSPPFLTVPRLQSDIP